MKCDIYKYSSKSGSYIFIESDNELSDMVPEDILLTLGETTLVKTINFDENSPLIAANPKEVIKGINANNYFIQGTKVTTQVGQVSEAGAAIGGGILAASLGFGPLGALIAAAAGFALANASKSEDKNGGSDDADS